MVINRNHPGSLGGRGLIAVVFILLTAPQATSRKSQIRWTDTMGGELGVWKMDATYRDYLFDSWTGAHYTRGDDAEDLKHQG